MAAVAVWCRITSGVGMETGFTPQAAVALMRGGDTPQIVELGRQALQGSLQLTLPPGTWDVSVGAENSAGLWARQDFGQVTVPG